MTRSTFPEHSLAPTDLFAEMESARRGDVDWKRGRLGLYMHYAGEDVLAIAKEAYQRFFSENALGSKAFRASRSSMMSEPPGIHHGMPTMAHVPHVDMYLRDVRAAVEIVRTSHGSFSRSELRCVSSNKWSRPSRPQRLLGVDPMRSTII